MGQDRLLRCHVPPSPKGQMLSALYFFLHAFLLAILLSKDWISCLSRRDSDRLPKVMRVHNSGQSRKGAALAETEVRKQHRPCQLEALLPGPSGTWIFP